jgi:hypothetical protein
MGLAQHGGTVARDLVKLMPCIKKDVPNFNILPL